VRSAWAIYIIPSMESSQSTSQASFADDLTEWQVAIDEPIPFPGNPRRGNVERIKASLHRFGQIRPIVMLPNGHIVAGNHTWRAAKELGWDTIAAITVDLSEEDAAAYLLADNGASDDATWDDTALIEVLDSLVANGSLLGTGFTPDDLDDLLASQQGATITEIETFTGDYAVPPEATAERWEDRTEGMNKEVVFLLPKEDYDRFIFNVNALKMRYDTESMARAIYEAVERESNIPRD
jgi:hypothetical protein